MIVVVLMGLVMMEVMMMVVIMMVMMTMMTYKALIYWHYIKKSFHILTPCENIHLGKSDYFSSGRES